MRILIAGATGQLGSAMVREFATPRTAPDGGGGHEVIALTRASLDITNHKDVCDRVASCAPDAIINCAGYNDVDGAEDNVMPALEVNAFAVRSLARAAAEKGAIFVHYSSDFVFDGETDRPYTEDDRPDPRSFYAISKLLGDWFALEMPRAYVLRVESLFGGCALGSVRPSSLERIADALEEGREAVVFTDRIVSPSFVVDVARATRLLVEGTATGTETAPRPAPPNSTASGPPQPAAPFGLYHCVNEGTSTWLQIAKDLARLMGAEPRLVPRALADVPLRARRPRYCALSPARLASAGIPMPAFPDALARYVRLRSQSRA